MMVLDYAFDGNLQNYLNIKTLSWKGKIRNLRNIAGGLNMINETN